EAKEEAVKKPEKIVPDLDYDKDKPVTLSNEVAADENKDEKAEKEQVTIAKDEGKILPKTATQNHNYIAFGLFLIFSGIYFRIVFRPKKAYKKRIPLPLIWAEGFSSLSCSANEKQGAT